MAAISKHIRRLRAARHMTQEDLAEKLFVTRQAVSAWETGRALPDVETLERIADALGADVMEVLYGTPRPDHPAARRRWVLLGAACAAGLAVLLFFLESTGVLGTWRNGLEYQFWDQGYAVAYEEVPGTYSLELDLNNPESNVGKVLYDDGAGCRITVRSLTLDPSASGIGKYRVVFQAQGTCTPSGGALVSGCYEDRSGKSTHGPRLSASAYTILGGERLPPNHRYTFSCLSGSENTFGFHIFPIETYQYGEFTLAEDLAAENGLITFTVSGLTRMTTRRDGRLARFFRFL